MPMTPRRTGDRITGRFCLTVIASALLVLADSGDVPADDLFGGPSSVTGDLEPGDGFTDPLTDPQFRTGPFEGIYQPWFEFKDNLSQNYHHDLGFDFSVLGQFTNSDLGEGDAASHLFRAYGTWTPLNPGGVNSGSLTLKVENRLSYTTVAPNNLGFDAGAVSVTGSSFGDAGWILTNLLWKQKLVDDRLILVFGQLDVTDYFDQYPFTSSLKTYLNTAFTGSPTMAAPNQGLGAGFGLWLTDHFYALAGIADANGNPAHPNFSVFETGETFQAFEFGFASSRQRQFLDNIHLTLWSVDARTEAGIPSGRGVAMSASWVFRDSWAPYLRAGYSDGGGALYQASVSTGIGHLTLAQDLMGIGINWSRPSGTDEQDDQWTLEAFYRYQVSKQSAVSLDGQVIANPANNPQQDTIGFLGIRTQLAF
jgi:porin